MDLTRHVRLIGITGFRSQLREARLLPRTSGKIQQTLKAQHLLKDLRTVAHCG
jgi:hypothetical protein